MAVILQTDNIMKKFDKEEILKGISLEIEENTFTAILGPSGSGKSTLLNVISGLLRPTEGSVICDGTVISELSEAKLADWKRNQAGHVFQNYLLLENLTVEENIKIGINKNGESFSFDRLVRILELTELLHKFPAQLSGGQQQRVAIARAVIKCPKILFCDEATGALDETNSKTVVELLHKIKRDLGVTVLFTTHNLQIAKTADRVITIKDGTICKDIRNSEPITASEMVWG
ncbi:ABC transporter ATP-binding protein [Roseburia sp. 499]|uniref:ABC transporter ATP-binding protein n=1 Tax=Roseburia sp. 499 TaxID=1261634 RepID=UPI000952BD8B|nr:ABC transporter ATP-binding protein [Roseburia sp. 499]WVK71013.1 ABC transporter ATP-binding protein [Roseburia sp. 499]